MQTEEQRIIEFYNNESRQYSQKRYSKSTETFIQFFFKRRRDIVLKMLKDITRGKNNLSMVDIACADGILTGYFDDKFPGKFTSIVGSDIAPKMIEVARDIYKDRKNISFFVRDECPKYDFDIALGLGYLSVANYNSEKEYLFLRLPVGKYYISTFASNISLYSKYKLRGESYLNDYLDFQGYKELLQKDFEIIKFAPYGLFVPKLWSIPFIARFTQPILEGILSKISPDLFHEGVFLLKRKI